VGCVVVAWRHAKKLCTRAQIWSNWYEQREDEVRNQAEIYRKLARDYERYRAGTMTTICEQIAYHYDESAQQFEKLAEQHRHLAAAARLTTLQGPLVYDTDVRVLFGMSAGPRAGTSARIERLNGRVLQSWSSFVSVVEANLRPGP
jgi:lysyl-tRNA synthetase class I